MPCAYWPGADEIFDRLEGAWSLSRIIEGQAMMNGTARFQRRGADTLDYSESGSTCLAGGQVLKSHREYAFERAPGGFAVYFSETPLRLFHLIRVLRTGETLSGRATHHCAPDVYESSYTFLPDGSFELRHLVRGPRKDYLSVSTFRRLSCRPPSSG